MKAILMDSEARDPAKTSDPTFGKLREPFLRVVNVARAFNASAQSGWYYLDALDLDPDSGSELNPLDTGRGRLIPTTSCDEYFAELALWLGVPPSSLHLVLPNVGNFFSPGSPVGPLGFLA